MKTPEGYEKDDICKVLDTAHGIWYFKPFMMGYGKVGVPDIVGVFRGRWFSIEVKREGKEPTTAQRLRMTEIEAAGGAAFWGTAEKVLPEFRLWIAGIQTHS